MLFLGVFSQNNGKVEWKLRSYAIGCHLLLKPLKSSVTFHSMMCRNYFMKTEVFSSSILAHLGMLCSLYPSRLCPLKVKPTCHCSVLVPEPKAATVTGEHATHPFLSHPVRLLRLWPSASASQVWDGITGASCHAWLMHFCLVLAFPDFRYYLYIHCSKEMCPS